MRLISCYIVGFGKFENRAFDLSAQLNVIKEDNGFGKTTLADFLRCMFYGLDGGRSKQILTNDRMKYMPWSGGAFGGALSFEFNGKRYRIERAFGRTAAGDTVYVFDGNNMRCYDFGDKAERLGEMLFGVDCDSFKNSVYVPQAGTETDGMPEDMKRRLSALFGAENGQSVKTDKAMERLDDAESALRSKRRPRKGKLDEIDERLEQIAQEKLQQKEALQQASLLREQARGFWKQKEALSQQLAEIEAQMQSNSRREEFLAKRETLEGMQARLEESRAHLQSLQAFFKGNDPEQVNVAGLERAVEEYYVEKESLQDIESALAETENKLREKNRIEGRMRGAKEDIDAYKRILDEQNRLLTPQTTVEKRVRRKGKHFFVFLFLLAAIFGATQLAERLALGAVCLGLGGIGLLYSFFRALPKRKKTKPQKGGETLAVELLKKEREYTDLKREWEECFLGGEEVRAKQEAQREQALEKIAGLKRGIDNFLGNFAFENVYDYRAATERLKERVNEYILAKEDTLKRETETIQFSQKDGGRYALSERLESAPSMENLDGLLRKKDALETEKQRAVAEYSRCNTQADALERSANSGFVDGEERLIAEKVRLERRLQAIRMAKEFLLRARENMAARYLQPVEAACRKYLQMLGGEWQVRYAADGKPLVETQGSFKEQAFLSVGSKDLLDFCARIAYVDGVFTKEKPPLILDDPFVNLDDKKTARAKELVKALAKEYQIVYLTCKEERRL